MRRNPTHLVLWICLATLTALACGDDTSGAEGSGGMMHVHEHVDGGKVIINCGLDELTPRVTSASSDTIRVQFIDGDPLPAEIYENDWLVEITDGSGMPLQSVQDFSMKGHMPEHTHGTKFDPVITAGDAPGQFHIRKLNLWMEGVWEVMFWADGRSESEAAVFEVCIPKT